MKLRVVDLLQRKGREVFSVDPDASVYDAISVMEQRNIGALVVMREGKLEGILSERDYARKVILRGRDSRSTEVREIMSSPVVTVGLEDSVEDCMKWMTETRIRHLPVLDAEEIVGMISIGDVVRAVIEDRDFHIQQLEGYIRGGG